MAGHITDGMVGGKWGYGLLAKFYMKKTDIEEAAKEADEQMVLAAVMAETAQEAAQPVRRKDWWARKCRPVRGPTLH